MLRRDLLRAAASAAALSLLPREAEAAWARISGVAAGDLPGDTLGTALTVSQRSVVAAVSDAILPRTDSPGATDVGVPAFVDLIVADYYGDEERAAFTAGIDAIDALATSMTGAPFASLAGAPLVRVMDALDQPADRTTPAARGYARLKGLVIHGYFTSEPVQRDVLRTNIMPGRYDGAAPMPAPRARSGADA